MPNFIKPIPLDEEKHFDTNKVLMCKTNKEGILEFANNEFELMNAYNAITKEFSSKKLVIGGKSLGARVSSMIDPPSNLIGYLFLGYPLHAPDGEKRVSKKRQQLLQNLSAPALFIEGDSDDYCDIDILGSIIAPLDPTLEVIEGADHSFNVEGRKRDEVLAQIAELVIFWLEVF